MKTESLSLPTLFREVLVNAGMPAIDAWWAHLDSSSREDALQLWRDCGQTEGALTVRVEGRFVAEREEEEATGFWHNDYYDYLVNHELYLVDRRRRVHICTRQPAAAEAVRAGLIPKDFSCPLGSADCPMRKVLNLSPGKSLRLSVTLGATKRLILRWRGYTFLISTHIAYENVSLVW